MPRRFVFTLFVLAALALPVVAVTPVDLPFRFTDGFICLEARVAQSAEPLNLVLDSGASASVLSLRTARRLHLPLGRAQSVRGVGVETTAYQLHGVQATARGLVVADLPLTVDLNASEELCSRPVDGLIGVDFFKGRVVQIDYARHVLRVFAPRPAEVAECLPIKCVNGVMCVPLSVNDSPRRWTRLDTGCNDALHWVIPRPDLPPERSAVSIGFITDTDDTALTSVGLGQRTIPTVKTALHGRPLFPGEAGLLGNGVLSQFTVIVDWPKRQVLLQDSPR